MHVLVGGTQPLNRRALAGRSMIREFRTERCGEAGQPEFTFKVDVTNVPRADVEWLIQTLERWVHGGERFRPDGNIQIGWGLLKIRRSSIDGTLELLEPDYSSRPPIEWVDTVTATLQHLRAMSDTCESYAIDEPSFPSLRDACIVCDRYASSVAIVIARGERSDWFIGCGDPAHDHQDASSLSRVSLYDAAQKQPSCLPFLALPPGALLALSPGTVQLFIGDERIDPLPGSYVQRRYSPSG